MTTPVSSTPATPIPNPTSRLPATSGTGAAIPRTRLPAATSPTAATSARSGPARPATAGPANEPTAIISTAPVWTIRRPGGEPEVLADGLQQGRVARERRPRLSESARRPTRTTSGPTGCTEV